MDLRDRVAVVTGGNGGIGGACAKELASAGARVAVWDLAPGADIECDVSDEESVAAAVAQTTERFGAPSLVVAAAGVVSIGAFVDVPAAEFDRIIRVNLKGVFLTLRCVAREMITNRLDGSLVAISSVNGMIADPTVVAYSASKAAVIQLVRVAALELGPHGIRVNAIAPGPTDTPMMAANLRTPGYADSVIAATPLRKVGSAELVAEATVNVMRSEWITGTAIPVDGGSSLVTARSNRHVQHVPSFQSADAAGGVRGAAGD